jgi:hypothetical protein
VVYEGENQDPYIAKAIGIHSSWRVFEALNSKDRYGPLEKIPCPYETAIHLLHVNSNEMKPSVHTKLVHEVTFHNVPKMK